MLQSAKAILEANEKIVVDEIAEVCLMAGLNPEKTLSSLGKKEDWEKSTRTEPKNVIPGVTSFVSQAESLDILVPCAKTTEASLRRSLPLWSKEAFTTAYS